MTLTKRIILTILGLIGFLTSIKLSFIYIDANFNPYALSSFCSINDFVDCDGVAKTVHSQFFGVPLAFWGLFLYFVFLFLTYADKLQNISIKNYKLFGFAEVFKKTESYISALGLFAFAISMSLMFLSLFEIKKICILCFGTYVLNLLIGLIAKPSNENFIEIYKTSFLDFINALKIKKYAVAFAIAVLITIVILAYTSITNVLAPQIAAKKELQYYVQPNGKEYKISGNILGDVDAKIVVHEYTDHQCPFCFVMNTMMLRAVSELKNIKVVHHNLPLDIECNPALKSQMHPNSCLMARYTIAAGLQGKYWDMNNLLFDKEFESEEKLLLNASRIGINTKQLKEDLESSKIKNELAKEIKEANEFGINGTPALRINMETHIGIMPYEELKEKLIKLGAIERK